MSKPDPIIALCKNYNGRPTLFLESQRSVDSCNKRIPNNWVKLDEVVQTVDHEAGLVYTSAGLYKLFSDNRVTFII